MNEPSENASLSPDHALPPVTPPNAKFLIPLFVIPFCIVTSIVLVWALFSWLAQQGGDPKVDIEALGRDNAYRWQAAHNLADALRNPRHAELREDAAAAGKLAELLEAELKKPLSTDDEARGREVNLQMYLCRALGEFLVPTGVPALVQAAAPHEGAADQQKQHLPVRLAALEALCVVLGNARESASGQLDGVEKEILPALLTAADYRADDPEIQSLATQVRMRAAFGLGLDGTPKAIERLAPLTLDPSPDVRYNAATGLARNGDARAVPLLIDMLNPEITEGVAAETIKEAQPFKRATIYQTALQASEKLFQRNTSDDFSQLRTAMQKFADTPGLPDDLRVFAREILAGKKP